VVDTFGLLVRRLETAPWERKKFDSMSQSDSRMIRRTEYSRARRKTSRLSRGGGKGREGEGGREREKERRDYPRLSLSLISTNRARPCVVSRSVLSLTRPCKRDEVVGDREGEEEGNPGRGIGAGERRGSR